MAKLTAQVKAPDFELQDTTGQWVRLSDLLARGPLVLVLTRGFM